MDGWNTTFLLGRPIFRGYVSFREGIEIMQKILKTGHFFLAVLPNSWSFVGANKAGRSLPSRAGHSVRNSQTLGPFEGLWKGSKQDADPTGRSHSKRKHHKSSLIGVPEGIH